MANIINKLEKADKRKKRFLSVFTAVFMVFTSFGDSLSVFADKANTIDSIPDVTGNAEKNAELLDVEDAEDKFLGIAGDFTIFVKDKFTIPAQSADIEGRLAAGKGIENNRNTYDIGSKYSGKGATVIVGGGSVDDILPTPAKGADKRIFAVSSDTEITPMGTYENFLDSFYITNDIIDFDAEFSKIESLSREIKNYESTGRVEENYSSYKLVGAPTDVNVFTLTPDEWKKVSETGWLQILVSKPIMDSYVIINVPGEEVNMPRYSLEFVQFEADENGNPVLTEGGQIIELEKINVKQDAKNEDGTFDDAELLCGHILYNAYEAEDVKYTGSMQGSLLAPYANVSGDQGGHVSGSTIAKSAEGFGIQAGSITFNPPKRKIVIVPDDILISKKDITGGSELPGAVLEIKSNDATADLSVVKSSAADFKAEGNVITFTSGKNPASLSGLPDGEYTLTEITSPDGYTINKETIDFTVKDGKTETSVAMEDSPSELSISKKAVSGEDEIPGAVLKLTLEKATKTSSATLEKFAAGSVEQADSNTSVKWTSGSAPQIFKGLPDGEYLLEESVAPDGYTVTGSVRFIIKDGAVESASASVPGINDSIVDSKNSAVVMKDELSKVVISKQQMTNSEELEGAELTLTYSGDKSFANVKQGENSGAVITVSGKTVKWTSGTKPAMIEGLPDGEYSLTEVRAPEGFEIAETIDFVLADGKTYLKKDGTVSSVASEEVIMLDAETPVVSKIVISKQSTAGSAEVPGAHLTVTAAANADLSKVTSESEVTVKDNTISWISGNKPVTIEGLPDGEYTLSESVAPDGYTITGKVPFTVKDGMVADSADNTVKMTDEFSEITVSKKDINGTDEIDGAELEITLTEATKNPSATLLDTEVSGGAKDVFVGKDTISFITDSKTQAKITMLPDGKYTLTEITSPDGYTLNRETVDFEIKEGVVVSGKEVEMLDKPSKVTISKTDMSGAVEVPGAKLILTLVKPEKTQGATLENQVNDKVKAADSSVTAITWTSEKQPLVLEKLPDGEYTLEESVAPDGYTITDKITFTIKDGVVQEQEFENDTVIMKDALSDVIISKKDINGTDELPGAGLTVTLVTPENEGASLIDVKVTGGAEENVQKIIQSADTIEFISGSTQTHLTMLPDGQYTLTETTSPDGYTVNKETVKFEIKDGKLTAGTEVPMLDKPSTVKVSKTDVAENEIPGAKLLLTLNKSTKNPSADLTSVENSIVKITADSDNRTVEWISGEEPVVLTGLPDGEYTLEESVAPDGYTITGNIDFVIENGEVKGDNQNTITMVDKYSSVTVSKKEINGTDELPGAKLTITLKEAADGVTLENVKVDGGAVNPTVGKEKITFVSGDKAAELTMLPDGKYELTETTSPDGYTLSDETVEFEVKNGVLVSGKEVEMFDAPSNISFSKQAVSNSAEVPGAVLTLTLNKAYKTTSATLKPFVSETIKLSADSDRVLTWTSGNEPVVINGLPDGEYTLDESVAPDGYTITDSIDFVIEDGKIVGSETDDEVIMKDALSKVTISKQKVSGAELPGAELTLTIAEDKSLENVTSESKITVSGNSIKWKSGTEPTVIEGIPDGTYTLTEDRAPLGFQIAESISFTVKNGKVVEYADGIVIMKDLEEPKPSNIIISKQSVSGSAEVPGAHLTIKSSDENADLSKVTSDSDIKTENNKITFVSGTSPVTITGLPDGDYTLEESIAPDGYTVTDSVDFTIEDGMLKDSKDNLVIMKDAPSEITISKREINKSEELPGAKLTVTLKEAAKNENADLSTVKVSGGASKVKVSDKEITFVSGTEKAVITQLPDGKYELKETTSPDGYTVNEETVEFEIREGVLVSPDEVVMLDKLSEIKISKTDITMENEIPGAVLKLTITQGYKTSGADLKAIVNDKVKLADESGSSVTWTSGTEPMILTGLPDGDYVLEESVAPDGYTITGSIKFTINNGKIMGVASTVPRPEDGRIDADKNTVIMIDKLSEVPFSKINVAENEIPGAKLSLTIAEKKDLSKVTSDSDITVTENQISWISGTEPVIIKGLPDGTYTLEETQAPDGYTVTESVTFTIENGIPSSDIIIMKDEYTKVNISKTNVAGDEIPGAELTLRQISGKKDLSDVIAKEGITITGDEIKWTSGNKPVVLEGLPDGEYILEETVAPDRYSVTESVKFRIINGEVQSVEAVVPRPEDSRVDSETNTVTMVDKLTKLEISKIDAAGSEIEGAKLTLELVKADDSSADLSSVTVSGGASEIVIGKSTVEFVSGKTDTVIEGVPDGEYTLTETQAPEGYEIAETISFIIENGKVAGKEGNKIVMVDDVIVTTTTPVTTTEATTTTPVTTTEATTTTVATTTEIITTTPVVTTTEATTTTTEATTTTTATITPPSFSISTPANSTGITVTDITSVITTTAATTTEATTTTAATTTEATTTTRATTTEATTTTRATTTEATTTTVATTTEATTTTKATTTEATTTTVATTTEAVATTAATTTEAVTTTAATTTEAVTTTAATTTEAVTTTEEVTTTTPVVTTLDVATTSITTTAATTTTTAATTTTKLTAKSTSSSPKTGDSSSTAAAVLVMVGALSAMILIRKKPE